MGEQQPVPVLEMFLIRHGESRGNVGLAGERAPFDLREDPPLTAKGRLQADLLGQALSGVDFDAVYASAMRRAVMSPAVARKQMCSGSGDRPCSTA